MKQFCRTIFCFCMVLAILSGCAAPSLSNHIPTQAIGTQPPKASTEATITAATETIPTTEAPTVPSTDVVTEPTTEPTVAETEPVHIHDFSPATCTSPKICITCGEKEGKAIDHSWQEATCKDPKRCTVCGKTSGKTGKHAWQAATCTEPKSCSVCGKTSGSPIGHDYSDGICKTCSAVVPEDAIMVWIPTKSGKKYHSKADCSNMSNPKQITQEEAEDQGFEPCKKCH